MFGRHANEAYSSLRIQDYKQWLRLRIDGAGALTIHAIGIDRVPRRWIERRGKNAGRIDPQDPNATPPRLVEQVTLRPRAEGGYAIRGIDQRGHSCRATRRQAEPAACNRLAHRRAATRLHGTGCRGQVT